MKISNISQFLHKIRLSPFHPQWFAFRHEKKRYEKVGLSVKGKVLDVGCGRQPLRQYLKPAVSYFSLDTPQTGKILYNSTPSVFGDAISLPFKNNSFDTVILLEVLEHLQNPTLAIQEARRVAKKGGLIILSVPFLYPIHDAPTDYQRWTRHGLDRLLDKNSLTILDRIEFGTPIESGVLCFNLSLVWSALKSPLLLRFPFLLLSGLMSLFLNIIGYTVSTLQQQSVTNPFATNYLYIAQELTDE